MAERTQAIQHTGRDEILHLTCPHALVFISNKQNYIVDYRLHRSLTRSKEQRPRVLTTSSSAGASSCCICADTSHAAVDTICSRLASCSRSLSAKDCHPVQRHLEGSSFWPFGPVTHQYGEHEVERDLGGGAKCTNGERNKHDGELLGRGGCHLHQLDILGRLPRRNRGCAQSRQVGDIPPLAFLHSKVSVSRPAVVHRNLAENMRFW